MEFGQFLYSLIVIFFMIIYFMILFNIIFDIFRSHDMGGFAKALWLIFILFIPVNPFNPGLSSGIFTVAGLVEQLQHAGLFNRHCLGIFRR